MGVTNKATAKERSWASTYDWTNFAGAPKVPGMANEFAYDAKGNCIGVNGKSRREACSDPAGEGLVSKALGAIFGDWYKDMPSGDEEYR